MKQRNRKRCRANSDTTRQNASRILKHAEASTCMRTSMTWILKHNQFRLLTLSKPKSMFKTKAERLQEAAGKKSKKDPFSNELADPQTFTDIIAMRSEAKGFTKAVKATIFALNPSSDNSEYVYQSTNGTPGPSLSQMLRHRLSCSSHNRYY